jgi:hypothetical protein
MPAAAASPLERAILQLEKMIDAQRLSALQHRMLFTKRRSQIRLIDSADNLNQFKSAGVSRMYVCQAWNKRSNILSWQPRSHAL